ncbi:MAG: GTPase HflX [Eubacteriales bacterium]|nr:GTPase HflX [Eubacteriales bacterium]
MIKINGNTDGIKISLLEELEALDSTEYDRSAFVPESLANSVAQITAKINREIAIYLSRDGRILDISIGVDSSVSLSHISLRRSEKSLSAVRCIHTHPNGDSTLSRPDLSALKSLRLDAMVALGVDENGKMTEFSTAFMDFSSPEEDILQFNHVSVKHLESPLWFQNIIEPNKSEEFFDTGHNIERAFLLGTDSEESLEELAALAESAGALVVGRAFQKRLKPDVATFIGSGKASQVAQEVQVGNANLIIADEELSNVQLNNLEKLLSGRVIDRTTLILDIFASRAKSREGKLQVELAQLNYKAGKLVGQYEQLSRLAGGIGTRGPGESKLESDRRKIRDRIAFLKRQLKELERQRDLQRKQRRQNAVPVVALAGYTNVGKSSLLNTIAGADAYEKDELFATLDTLTRKVTLKDGVSFLLVDSVGFIRKLPTELIEAFHSTLEEAVQADLIIIVSDAADPNISEKHRIVEEVLSKIGATEQKRIEVINKCDLLEDKNSLNIPNAIMVSAKSGEGIEKLLNTIAKHIKSRQKNYDIFVPYSEYDIISALREAGNIITEEHQELGTLFKVSLNQQQLGKLLAKSPGLDYKLSKGA